MSGVLRFVLVLVGGLALLTWAAFTVASNQTWAWFERDLQLRSVLAVSGARQSLVDAWGRQHVARLEGVLSDIARDERVLGLRACAADGGELAAVGEAMRGLRETCDNSRPPAQDATGAYGFVDARDAQNPVHVTVVPVVSEGRVLGTVVLAHDLRFVGRRVNAIRRLLLVAFGVLALVASVFTLIVTRLSWRSWNREVRLMLLGASGRSEFAPLMRDVQDLVRRLSDEVHDDAGAPWGPVRLKETLQRHLHGERIVIVANREPYIHQFGKDGRIGVTHPASGLVTALEPVMRACSGVWVAHGSGNADRETADAGGLIRVPPGEESYTLRRVWLTPEQERGYYYGFANEGLWPLCHVAHTRPVFRSTDWDHYRDVNAAFADAVAQEAEQDDPVILVQDYHFALLPRLIRRRLPRATILTFWHIPWPNAERVAICPWKSELLDGLLGSSILGFHTQLHCNNFLESVDRYLETRIDRETFSVHCEGRSTLVRPYPISIEWPNHWASLAPPVSECRHSVFAELGLPATARLGVGVDRLDYTKGIEERLLAVERLFERHPDLIGTFVFVQLAAPSRSAIDEYRSLDARVAAIADRVNARLGRGRWQPLILKRTHHEPQDVFRYYRAADLCYVSSLHDGMNLVAKEFVSARDDERGALVLSTFAGAARELPEALVVNPYNLDEAADALAAALRMPPEEQRDRMRAMRSYLSEFNVYRWAGRMLIDASRVRQRERLAGRFSSWRSRFSFDTRTGVT